MLRRTFLGMIGALVAAPRLPRRLLETQLLLEPVITNNRVVSCRAVLYVAPTGRDDCHGTAQEPFRSIRRALSQAQAGTTIFVRDGTYLS